MSKVRRPPDEAHRGHPEFIQPESHQERDGKTTFLKPGHRGTCAFPHLVQLGHSGWTLTRAMLFMFGWMHLPTISPSAATIRTATTMSNYKKFWPADVHLIGKGYHPLPHHLLADLPGWRLASRCRSRYSVIRGCWSATARCQSRSATLSMRTIWFACLVWMPSATTFCTRMPFANDGVLSTS